MYTPLAPTTSTKLQTTRSIKYQLITYFAVLFTLLMNSATHAAGLLQPTNQNSAALEIKTHHVTVTIENGYAITEVEQTFYNPSTTDLEAHYAFPVPHKAAVGEFTYWIDGKPITAEVLEKEQAQQAYDQARQQGREAGLVTQNKTKTFNIKVTPVRALKDVRVRLVYLQKTEIDTGIGRYAYPLEDGGVDAQQHSFWTFNESVSESFSFTVNLNSAEPIDQLRLPKHPQAKINKISDKQWIISLTNRTNTTEITEVETHDAPITSAQVTPSDALPQQNAAQLNEDIILYWRLRPGLPASLDMIAHRAENQHSGTFMLTLTPGDDLAPITEGRDWIFILDYSGSMRGKYNSMIQGVKQGLTRLSAEDRFRVIIFNNQSREITKGFTAATPENVNNALNRLSKNVPDGSTNLYQGLLKGLEGLNADRSSAIILVTDGEANVGTTHKKDFLDLLKSRDIRLFTMVMGNSANKPLLEGMAQISNGFAITVSNSDDIVGRLMEVTSRLTHEAMHNLKLDFSGVDVYDVTPQNIGSLYRGEQLTVLGRYRGEGTVQVKLSAKVSGQPKQWQTHFELPTENTHHPELERLWAFASIEHLQAQMDYLGSDTEAERAITDLALSYGLVTNYTSLVVLREEDFEAQQISRHNAKRVTREHVARQQRQQHQQRAGQVDEHQSTSQQHSQRANNPPMFSGPRASHGSGGGALEYWFLLGLIALGILKKQAAQKREFKTSA